MDSETTLRNVNTYETLTVREWIADQSAQEFAATGVTLSAVELASRLASAVSGGMWMVR